MSLLDPMKSDQSYMDQAFRQAQFAWESKEVPIGCVIVAPSGKIIGKGYNQVETLKDPTAHAEILAIGAACQTIENWRLDECTMYVTLEPCPMCAGAILNSRIGRLVYAARDKRLGACGSTQDVLKENPINRIILVEGGLMENEALDMIRAFFQELRNRNKAQKIAES